METWEKILAGAFALLILFLFRPGIRAAMKHSQEAQDKDWKGALIPLLAVVVFVILLLAVAAGGSKTG